MLDAFQPFGRIKEIRLVREKLTKTSRGFAFVEFDSLDAARSATESNAPIVIEGCTARVMFARNGKVTYSGGAPTDGSGNSGFEHAQQKVKSALTSSMAGLAAAREVHSAC